MYDIVLIIYQDSCVVHQQHVCRTLDSPFSVLHAHCPGLERAALQNEAHVQRICCSGRGMLFFAPSILLPRLLNVVGTEWMFVSFQKVYACLNLFGIRS